MHLCSKLPYKLCGRSFQNTLWPPTVICHWLLIYSILEIISAPCEEFSLSVYKQDKNKECFFNYLCFLLLWDTHLTRLTHIRCVHVCVCLWYKGVWVENNNSNSVRLHRGRGVILQLQTSRCESAGWLTEGMCWIFPPRKIIFQPE